MNAFLATVKQVGQGLYLVSPLSAVDPGYGVGAPPVDPGYGHPGFAPGHPDAGLPWGPGHPDQDLPWGPGHPSQGLPWGPGHPSQGLPSFGHPGNALPVPPPEGIVTPPIVLPSRPQLPAGSGIVVPLPDDVPVPTPQGTSPNAEPYILWFGPGTKSSVAWLQPAATPKK
jgi:hypothetical protein